MPFNEAIYREMKAFFSAQTTANVLLLGMDSTWKSRFRQDFADRIFQTAPWAAALPEAWQGSFSSIVLAPGIEESLTPESLLASLQPFLTTCGALIVPFRNPWHWRVFRSWIAGELHYGENPLFQGHGQLFSFPEMVRLAKLAHYEDFTVRQIFDEGPTELIAALAACGVNNAHREMETSWWIVRFAVLDAHTVRLKEQYTEDVRRVLSRLLHRLENGIEEETTVTLLRQLVAQEGVTGDYLEDFVANIAAEPAALCAALQREGLL